ncbi:NAD(P)-binding protein [Guyanagaster necrorhizus]|uniref:NAD(P)-binding protein n=1 Tax=Guyanagaster necrorhizus TaxID=856835 RepID=A0A9P7VV10_9AGAR|nr:NAD(P)-binding protein [Guyanagaster necrorhizus MCA 3950]KAG7446654.1 NAD(P)-binding protein [Guyanagaster necrorhizus MCA 3950]
MLSSDTDLVAVADDELFRYGQRVKDKVILIVGASKDIGRETAIRFAFYGAKVVIGDQDASKAQDIAHKIVAAGGVAMGTWCNATVWDDVVTVFDLAVKTYGGLDIIVANTGVPEVGKFKQVNFDSNGKPVKPDLTTIDVDLAGILYAVHLAQYYLARNRQPDDLKALVVLGSMASWHGLPQAPLYSASGCAILGAIRSLYLDFEHKDIRTAVISPSYGVSDSDGFLSPAEASTKGLELSPIIRIAGSIFYSATNPAKKANGRAWLIRHDGPLYMVPREDLDRGVFRAYNKRFNGLIATLNAVKGFSRGPGAYFS